jgi:hypothetical protein
MRVATIFTGTAAVATFAPAVAAAAGHAAGTGHQACAVDKAPALPLGPRHNARNPAGFLRARVRVHTPVKVLFAGSRTGSICSPIPSRRPLAATRPGS